MELRYAFQLSLLVSFEEGTVSAVQLCTLVVHMAAGEVWFRQVCLGCVSNSTEPAHASR